MEPKFNIWLEINDKVALSVWRVKLLEAIAQTDRYRTRTVSGPYHELTRYVASLEQATPSNSSGASGVWDFAANSSLLRGQRRISTLFPANR